MGGGWAPQIADVNTAPAHLAEWLCKGGYPEPILRSLPRARQWHRQYISAIIRRDVQDIAKIHDEDTMARLVELLSYRTASLLNINNLAQELAVQRETTERYLSILERLFLISRLPAWHRNHAKRLIKATAHGQQNAGSSIADFMEIISVKGPGREGMEPLSRTIENHWKSICRAGSFIRKKALARQLISSNWRCHHN